MMLGILALANPTRVRLIDEATGTHFVDADGKVIDSGVATVTSQLARVVFDDWFQPGFYVVVSATILVLLLAANTAFNGFPSLASMLAKDGYLPRQPYTRGDRLPIRTASSPRPRRDRVRAGVRRLGDRADPAIHHGRVHLLHGQPDRPDRALDGGC